MFTLKIEQEGQTTMLLADEFSFGYGDLVATENGYRVEYLKRGTPQAMAVTRFVIPKSILPKVGENKLFVFYMILGKANVTEVIILPQDHNVYVMESGKTIDRI